MKFSQIQNTYTNYREGREPEQKKHTETRYKKPADETRKEHDLTGVRAGDEFKYYEGECWNN